jgi:hypothetical protein
MKNWLPYFRIVLALLIPVNSGSTSLPISESACPAPQVTAINRSTGSASFSWNAVGESSQYVVFYIRQGDNYNSQPTYTLNTSITYFGLSSGVYDFYFATVCGSELSEIIIVEDLVL